MRRSRVLYATSCVFAVAAGLWLVYGNRAHDPSSEAEATKLGFHSAAEMKRVGRLMDTRRIDALSAGDERFLRDLARRDAHCRWFALGAIGNLVGYDLQSRFRADVERVFTERPGHELLLQALIDGWMERDGAQTVRELARSENKRFAAIVKDHLRKRGDLK